MARQADKPFCASIFCELFDVLWLPKYVRQLRDEVDHPLGSERPCIESYHGEEVGLRRQADLVRMKENSKDARKTR